MHSPGKKFQAAVAKVDRDARVPDPATPWRW